MSNLKDDKIKILGADISLFIFQFFVFICKTKLPTIISLFMTKANKEN